MTLAPGLYKWSTGVTIPTDLTLAGGPNDVWIFQIAGNLTAAGAKAVILSGGADSRNIFWQVAGGVGVQLGTTSHFEGNILAQAAIHLRTGASINGRLLAQTAVTLDSNAVTAPNAAPNPVTLVSATVLLGPYAYAAGQSVNLASRIINIPVSGSMRFYRLESVTPRAITSIHISAGNVIVTYN
jgi:hypothetical protein